MNSLIRFFFNRATATLLMAAFTLAGCHHNRQQGSEAAVGMTERQIDSASFATTHHYSQNYNFVVKADSIGLLRQQPEEALNELMTDTLTVGHGERLVVADIRIMPTDTIDSVWVQVARDQATFGWAREAYLLNAVVPDDPISQFISTFSDTHLLIFLVVIGLIAGAYLTRTMLRSNAKIVHFNDINSLYPTLLATLVASAATFYASIQLYAPDVWRHFYYHPTLNPFIVPPLLSIFLLSVWTMLITSIAVVDVARRQLRAPDALLYLCGLAGVCAINYIVFSLTTLYYVGYPLYAAYLYFALNAYLRHSRCAYLCGKCGSPMHDKGRCPVCGTENV